MKKNLKALILTLCCVLLLPAFASASPVYFTLQSTISGMMQDTAGLIQKSGVRIGDLVSHVIMIDKDRVGSTTYADGSVTNHHGLYYSSLYSGILKGVRTSPDGSPEPPYDPFMGLRNSQENYIVSGADVMGPGFNILSANQYSSLIVSAFNFGFSDLKVGAKLDIMDEIGWKDLNGNNYSQLRFEDVTITKVSNTAPTPLPGALLLMSGGLGMLGFIRKKFSKNS